jgi:hypothetical protein
VPVVGLPPSPAPSQLWVGFDNACVLIGDEVYCWGDPAYGSTGTGSIHVFGCQGIANYCTPPGSPVVMLRPDGGVGGPLTGVKDLYLGYYFGCAITTSGGLACWGEATVPTGTSFPYEYSLGAEPFPLADGGTPSNVTHVTSSNATYFETARFSLSDETYSIGAMDRAVAVCQ